MHDPIRRLSSADPKSGYLSAKAEIDTAIRRVLESGVYVLGTEVAAFEAEFAALLGVTGCVSVANGTDAVELALRALDVGPGDRVATVANTVTATIAAIVAAGAEPVFVDIDPDSMLMAPEALELVLREDSARTIKAVIPVHLYGHPCDMGSIAAMTRAHGAKLVEDCAQAHGAIVDGRTVGNWGDLAAFSFYPTKNLGAIGDGGAVVGVDSVALDRLRSMRQYGWKTRYVSEVHGRNSRLDELQAAILRARLPRLAMENAYRAELAGRYRELLGDASIKLPVADVRCVHVWHQFVVRTPHRDDLRRALEAEGIFCGVLYPVPIYRQPAYARPLDLPHTERACAEVLSLPLHPGLAPADVERVATALLKAL